MSRPAPRPAAPKEGRAGGYRPRSDRPPHDSLDALDRHLLRATESDETLRRYRAIIGELRRVVVVLAVVVLACALLTGAGVAAVLLLLGRPVEVAVGVGVGAGGAVALKAGYLGRRWLRRRR